MALSVKFFASLRESVGTAEVSLSPDGVATAADAWRAATHDARRPDNVLCAVNHEYVDVDTRVADGDEVAFFPPVTGG